MFDQVYTKNNSLLFHFISSPYWLVSISYTIILNCYFKFNDHIELLLFQFLIELYKFKFFMTKSNCCFNLSLNWCFNSHDHIQLLFQFNTIPIQKHLINCKEFYSLQLHVSCHLLQITKFSKTSWSLVAKNKLSTTRCLTIIYPWHSIQFDSWEI
jgi:hypothetical protein